MNAFELTTEFTPSGDQPAAIAELTRNLREGVPHQTLLGVTGSGKTFTVANVVAELKRPALVLAPNKILAAQLYGEFKSLFPNNAVEYFVSFYDYYQPEAYVPNTDTYIEKEAIINDEIDKMRHSATMSVLTRRDVVVVASVSCIYGIGSPEMYQQLRLDLFTGEEAGRDAVIASLVGMQYERNDFDFHRGTFRVRGDTVDVFPAYEADVALRIEFFGDEIDGLYEIDPLRGSVNRSLTKSVVFPGTHYATTADNLQRAIRGIESELEERLAELRAEQKPLELERLEQRTRFDIEMLQEIGTCSGIENYSRHLDGRMPGEPPYTLLDYFPDDFLLVIDESHIAVPQLDAMYKGDRSRKDKLVEYGFRLPCARDNRPLKFEEFWQRVGQVIYTSATPGDYELEKSEGLIIEQVVRPTGLIDPAVEVRPASDQVDDLIDAARDVVGKGERVLVTTLTKRMAEDLTDYLRELQMRVRYMHSDIDTLERIEIIRALREGEFDILVGINLLREGLDLPEVGLVAILDADKEGYLRSERSLIQTCGRAARNVEGRVIMYADSETGSMRRALGEMDRRREKQIAYNEEHGITPRSVSRAISSVMGYMKSREEREKASAAVAEEAAAYELPRDVSAAIKKLRKKMQDAADNMDFEQAARYRDRMRALEQMQVEQAF